MSTKTRLGIMMFLQYAIWGAWAPVLSTHLNALGFTGGQTGWIFALLPLATIIAPVFGGQIADRWLPSEKVIAWLQLSGGILLLVMSQVSSFPAMFALMLLYCLFYAPTLAITNSIAMVNLEDTEKEFGGLRVWGTIGWIAANWMLTGWRSMGDGLQMNGDAAHPAKEGGGEPLGLPGSLQDAEGKEIPHLHRHHLRGLHRTGVLLYPDRSFP